MNIILEWAFVGVLIVGFGLLLWREQKRREARLENSLDKAAREAHRISRHIRSALLYLVEERNAMTIADMQEVMGPCCERCRKRIEWNVDAWVACGMMASQEPVRFLFNHNCTKYGLTPEGRQQLAYARDLPMEEDPLILPREKTLFRHRAWHEAP